MNDTRLIYPSRVAGSIAKRADNSLIHWSRRRASWWVGLVLPGLFLRALIPLGFMPMFGPDFRVQLALCEGYAPAPMTAMDMSMDMPMDTWTGDALQHHPGEPSSGNDGTPAHQDHRACPYGASPALAGVPALMDVPGTVQVSATSLVPSPQVAHFEIVPRAHMASATLNISLA